MKTNHLSQTQLEKYIDKEMNNEEILEVKQHLELCSKCRTKVAIWSRFEEDFFSH